MLLWPGAARRLRRGRRSRPWGGSAGRQPAGPCSRGPSGGAGLATEARRTLPTGLLGSLQSCFACGERGAAINCQGKGCNRSFHLPCASGNGCVTQFFRAFRSFCSEHRPEQAVAARPDADTNCIICMEQLDQTLSFGTMVCPACRAAWFHRGCIQGQAISAGRECFRCPQCKNKRRFLPEMLKMGILVPFRTPAWEEEGRYEELYERHNQCDAGRCLYRQGRERAEESGPWELLLCSSCASKGTHRRCSALPPATESWECDGCAGVGPAPSAQPEPSGSNTSSEPGAGASSSPVPVSTGSEPDLASSSTSSQDGPTSSSGSATSSSSESDLASTSTSSQDEAEASSGSAAPESSPQAGEPGPERRPGRSRLYRRSQHPYSRR
ncbi:PHD finger protein 7-like [Rhea pennata]|uniref:PHD finger protein 7-like n=1 Tax=Rhea pennata TaxID=8795 RepID=UPI002E257608